MAKRASKISKHRLDKRLEIRLSAIELAAIDAITYGGDRSDFVRKAIANRLDRDAATALHINIPTRFVAIVKALEPSQLSETIDLLARMTAADIKRIHQAGDAQFREALESLIPEVRKRRREHDLFLTRVVR